MFRGDRVFEDRSDSERRESQQPARDVQRPERREKRSRKTSPLSVASSAKQEKSKKEKKKARRSISLRRLARKNDQKLEDLTKLKDEDRNPSDLESGPDDPVEPRYKLRSRLEVTNRKLWRHEHEEKQDARFRLLNEEVK